MLSLGVCIPREGGGGTLHAFSGASWSGAKVPMAGGRHDELSQPKMFFYIPPEEEMEKHQRWKKWRSERGHQYGISGSMPRPEWLEKSTPIPEWYAGETWHKMRDPWAAWAYVILNSTIGSEDIGSRREIAKRLRDLAPTCKRKDCIKTIQRFAYGKADETEIDTTTWVRLNAETENASNVVIAKDDPQHKVFPAVCFRVWVKCSDPKGKGTPTATPPPVPVPTGRPKVFTPPTKKPPEEPPPEKKGEEVTPEPPPVRGIPPREPTPPEDEPPREATPPEDDWPPPLNEGPEPDPYQPPPPGVMWSVTANAAGTTGSGRGRGMEVVQNPGGLLNPSLWVPDRGGAERIAQSPCGLNAMPRDPGGCRRYKGSCG